MSTQFVFEQAKKEKIWVKMLLGGTSGSGKTKSALRIADGLVSKAGGTGIAVIETEEGRAKYYAGEHKFNICLLKKPYDVKSYIGAIDAAVEAGFKVIIIDSITHEWEWCLAEHAKLPGNSWINWGKINPKHDSFRQKVLESPCHIISTVRAKDKYEAGKNDSGKSTVEKLGLGLVQRDNVEYDYTVSLMINQSNHCAMAMKDNTHLFEERNDVLTEQDGINLYEWANGGEGEMPTYKKSETFEEAEVDNVSEIIGDIKKCFQEFKDDVNDNVNSLYDVVVKCGAPKNFTKITDEKIAKKVLNTVAKEVKNAKEMKLQGENK